MIFITHIISINHRFIIIIISFFLSVTVSQCHSVTVHQVIIITVDLVQAEKNALVWDVRVIGCWRDLGGRSDSWDACEEINQVFLVAIFHIWMIYHICWGWRSANIAFLAFSNISSISSIVLMQLQYMVSFCPVRTEHKCLNSQKGLRAGWRILQHIDYKSSLRS